MQKKHDDKKHNNQAHSITHYNAEQLLPDENAQYAYRPVADDLWAPETFLDFYDAPEADDEYPHST